jgi:hypothetical protein
MKYFAQCVALVTGFIITAEVTLAQEVNLSRGKLDFLKGETSINVELTYDKMTVGEFGKEADYVKKKKEEMNEKDVATGTTWATKWEEDKKERYEPKFILGFTGTSKMTVSKDAKYTLILNTKALEPGYQAGISKKNAGIDCTVTIVATADRTKKLAVLSIERPGSSMFRGAAFDAGSRIADAYYLSGQKLGKFILKGDN